MDSRNDWPSFLSMWVIIIIVIIIIIIACFSRSLKNPLFHRKFGSGRVRSGKGMLTFCVGFVL